MTDETTSQTTTVRESTGPTQADNSQIFGVSVRAWIALVLVSTVCLMAVLGVVLVLVGKPIESASVTKINEPLYSLAIAAAAFYLGGSQLKKTS